jgi:surface polysaccharide O-acyltransferase-like enzyme
MRQESYIINVLKSIAIILVVLGHSIAYYIENIGDTTLFIQIIMGIIYVTHVPLFVIIMGYLSHPQDVKGYYIKKIYRLLIPYITFSILKIIYANVVSPGMFEGGLTEQIYDIIFVGTRYWFIYMCLGLYILAPMMWKLEKYNKLKEAILVLFAINVIKNVLGISFGDVFQISYIIHYLPFFLFGRYLATNVKPVCEILGAKSRLYMAALYIVIGIFVVVIGLNFNTDKIGYILKWIKSLAFITALYLIVNYFVETHDKIPHKFIELISKYTLQIMFFDSFYKTILYILLPRISGYSVFIIIIEVVFDLFLCVVSCIVLEKIPIVSTLVGLKRK